MSGTGQPENTDDRSRIVADEDWKAQVKADDAKLDAARSASAEESPGDEAAGEVPIPPASFGTLLQMLSTQAIVALGLVPTPEGQTIHELPLARHFIDLLAVLDEKCRGNLSSDEAKYLEGTLHELRMAYIEVSKMQDGTA